MSNHYKHITLSGVQYIQAIPAPGTKGYTLDYKPEPIIWDGPAFEGTISDEEIEKFTEYKDKKSGEWNGFDNTGRNPEGLTPLENLIACHYQLRQASRPKEVEQPVQQEEPVDHKSYNKGFRAGYKEARARFFSYPKEDNDDVQPSTPIVEQTESFDRLTESEVNEARIEALKIRDRMYSNPYVQESEAKRCALIAVDIVLTDCVHAIGISTPFYKFYEQVKIELQSL